MDGLSAFRSASDQTIIRDYQRGSSEYQYILIWSAEASSVNSVYNPFNVTVDVAYKNSIINVFCVGEIL